MTDFHRINAPRVEKLVATLEVIDKSARSNKATAGEWAALLGPVTSFIEGVAGGVSPAAPEDHPKPAPTPAPQRGTRVPQWATVRAMAEKAPLGDLTVAMAVYLNRIDEALKG